MTEPEDDVGRMIKFGLSGSAYLVVMGSGFLAGRPAVGKALRAAVKRRRGRGRSTWTVTMAVADAEAFAYHLVELASREQDEDRPVGKAATALVLALATDRCSDGEGGKA